MFKRKRITAFLLLVCMLLSVIPFTGIIALASGTVERTDAMTEIEASLSSYKQGETQSVADDGYIGILVEVSVYFDTSNEIITGSGIDATPVVVYVVNTCIERIGTDSDVDIISSMLARGYIVVIFDYLNNEKAVSPALDWSVQGQLRPKVTNGTFLKNAGLSAGSYCNNLVAPAGYDVEFNHVFWEIDKHGSDGTFEKIVEVWNNDFRSWNAEKLVKWVDADGNRKPTQNGHDGTTPVWLDVNGVEASNGEYVRIKHTLAESIEDCVQADGAPVDLSLYMHITYPTSPDKDVPVMTLSCSSGHLAKGTQNESRPQFTGFLFNGYAAVTFDYGYTPMARDDHYGYFDGSTPEYNSITGDNVTYSIHWYNEAKIDTAAMRYLRYLSASEHSKYTFKDTAIGVYGNSKGGWATLLGEEHPELIPERRIVPGYSGESRYEAGKTETVGAIDGGEVQPWLSYGGKTLDSGADFIYSSCGGGAQQITAEHAPTYISCNVDDGSYYITSNQFVHVCKRMDVPAMWFEVGLGHTFAYGPDLNYGVDTYEALFAFANYYLRGDAVKVMYVSRDTGYSGMPSNAPIVVKFTGAVNPEEVSKITLKDDKGNTVNGTWSAQFGNTEWTLDTATLDGSTVYTLSIPAGITGDNGKGMESDYTYTFETGYEANGGTVSTVKTDKGTYVYFTVPNAEDVTEFDVNVYTLRLNVSNEAVNRLSLYSLSDFSASSPDNATVGALATSVAVAGAGQYDVDLTELAKGMTAGDTVAFLLKEEKTAGETVNNYSSLAGELGTCTVASSTDTYANYTFDVTPDGVNALKITTVNESVKYDNNHFYQNPVTILKNKEIIKKGNLVEEDVGRRFVISMRIYDTASRIITVKLNNCSSSSKQVVDYNGHMFNYWTKANDWIDIEFEYTVYEPLMAETRGYIA